MKLRISEAQLQKAVVGALIQTLPRQATFHFNANETPGRVGWTKKMQQLGQRAGWPDIQIIYQGRSYFVELKAPDAPRKNNGCSVNQIRMHRELASAGCPVAVCRSVREVLEWVGQHVPIKGVEVAA